jgi:hypothetical protein
LKGCALDSSLLNAMRGTRATPKFKVVYWANY